MFGIGLPELILIMVIALLVVGPEKLPGLARTIAGYVVELKKAANTLKQSLNDEEDQRPWEGTPRDFTLPEGFSAATGIVPEPEPEPENVDAQQAAPADTVPESGHDPEVEETDG